MGVDRKSIKRFQVDNTSVVDFTDDTIIEEIKRNKRSQMHELHFPLMLDCARAGRLLIPGVR